MNISNNFTYYGHVGYMISIETIWNIFASSTIRHEGPIALVIYEIYHSLHQPLSELSLIVTTQLK